MYIIVLCVFMLIRLCFEPLFFFRYMLHCGLKSDTNIREKSKKQLLCSPVLLLDRMVLEVCFVFWGS